MKTVTMIMMTCVAMACGAVDRATPSEEPADDSGGEQLADGEVDQGLQLWPNQVDFDVVRGWYIDDDGQLQQVTRFSGETGQELTEEEFRGRIWQGIDQVIEKSAVCNSPSVWEPCDHGVGGPGGVCFVPDNRRVTMCAIDAPFAGSLTAAGFNRGMDFNLNWKLTHSHHPNSNGQLDGYSFTWRYPEASNPGQCPGVYEVARCCDDDGNCGYNQHCLASDRLPPQYQTKTDLLFTHADLGNTPNRHCNLPRRAGGYLMCTHPIKYPKTYTANGGCGAYPYIVLSGAHMAVDSARINAWADSHPSGNGQAWDREMQHAHAFCHELGHYMGVLHYPHWEDTPLYRSCMSQQWRPTTGTTQEWSRQEEWEVKGGPGSAFGPTPYTAFRPPHQTREW